MLYSWKLFNKWWPSTRGNMFLFLSRSLSSYQPWPKQVHISVSLDLIFNVCSHDELTSLKQIVYKIISISIILLPMRTPRTYLSIHVQPVDFDSGHSHLVDGEFDVDCRVGVWYWGACLQVDLKSQIKRECWCWFVIFFGNVA